jgi:hypothetical protein
MGPRSAKESKYGALEHLVIIAFVTNSLVIGPCPHGRLPSSISDNHRLCFRTSGSLLCSPQSPQSLNIPSLAVGRVLSGLSVTQSEQSLNSPSPRFYARWHHPLAPSGVK